MKNFFIKAVTLILVFALSLTALVGCKGDGDDVEYGDAYVGELSTDKYDTMDDAVDAFIVEEYIGETITEVKNTTYNTNELTEEEVTGLGISEEELEGVNNVYSCEVSFNDGNSDRTETFYLLIFDDGIKYQSKLPEKGEMITKSYYESVMKNSAMTECKVSGSMNIGMKYNFDGLKGSGTSKTTIEMINTETACYAKIKITIMGESSATEEYIVATDEGIRMFVSYGSEFEDWSDDIEEILGVDPTSVKNLYELNSVNALEYDHTYFEKTDYGFSLSGEKMQQALNEVLGEINGVDEMEDSGVDIDVSGLTIKYYVQDGRLVKMAVDGDFKMSLDFTEDGDGIWYYDYSFDYVLNTYEPQTVKLPKQVQDLLNA